MNQRRLFLRWTSSSALGILIGFAFAAIVGLLIATVVGGDDASFKMNTWGPGLVMVGAGFVEGYLLGVLQSTPLRRVVPEITQKTWAIHTAIGGAVAWGIYMILSPLLDIPDFASPSATTILAGIGVLCLLTGVLATAQWMVVRKYFKDGWLWIPLTIVGWLLGLAVSYVGALLIKPSTSTFMTVAISVVFGFLMGGFSASATGLYLLRKARST